MKTDLRHVPIRVKEESPGFIMQPLLKQLDNRNPGLVAGDSRQMVRAHVERLCIKPNFMLSTKVGFNQRGEEVATCLRQALMLKRRT